MIKITAEQLREKLKPGSKCKVINVLAPEWFKDCHISGSVNVPEKQVESQVASWDKKTEIVVYCAHNQCGASGRAYLTLTKLGFTNIAAYEGGMKEWGQKGYAKEGECKLDYLK